MAGPWHVGIGGDGGVHLCTAARTEALYSSGYRDEELDDWAERIVQWTGNGEREAFVYFDNDAKGHAPFDAERLAARLERLDR